MRKKKLALAAFLAVVLLVSGLLLPMVTANAAWSNDPSVNTPICTADGEQGYPQIISDGAGGVIIVWEDYRSGNWDIYAQRVDRGGDIIWTVDGVPICNTTDNQTSPKIVSDGLGGAIITWQDRRRNNNIYAQRVDALGNKLWIPNGVALSTTYDDKYTPEIASDGDSGAIIAWMEHPGSFYDIYAQRVDASGNVLWTADGIVICQAADNQIMGTIISNGAGGAFIAWWDKRNGNSDIFAQQVDTSGNAIWINDGVAVCTADESQIRPDIISDDAGGVIITWWDIRSNDGGDIYAQRVNASGNTVWKDDGIAVRIADQQQASPKLVSDDMGGAIIVWYDNYLSKGDIYAQRLDNAGNLLWEDNGVAICTAANGQSFREIVSDGSSGAIISWVDHRNDSGDIYAQRVYTSGNILWKTDGIAICIAPNIQEHPCITSDGLGGAIITWQDNRDGNYDIYAQQVYSNGLLVPPTAPQLWYLDSETGVAAPNGYEMEKSGGPGDDGQTGSVNIGPGDFAIWLADQAAVCDVTFPSGSWVVEIRTDSDWGTQGDKCAVTVGGWNTPNGWYEIPTMTATTITWDAGFNILTILLQTDSGTIYQDDYLALSITNEDSGPHEVYTEGRSSLRSPDTDPGYPVPELATGILLGLGLAGLLGYLGLIKRKHTAISG